MRSPTPPFVQIVPHAASDAPDAFFLVLEEQIGSCRIPSPDTDGRGNAEKEIDMSVKGEIKEGAGFVKEEMNEHGKSPDSQRKAQEGRNLRNEGRVEDGKAPKTTKPGTGHPEK
jgi:hypothetical protein